MIFNLLTVLLCVITLATVLWVRYDIDRQMTERDPSNPHTPSSLLQELGELSPAEYQDVHINPWSWTAMRVGGGGVFKTPELPRADAIEYVTRCGTHQLCAVDDVHKIIFYRSH